MIKYIIDMGSLRLTDENPATADLKSLRYEFNTNADGQRLDMVIANIDGKYNGYWDKATEVKVTLIDEGYTATPGSDLPQQVYRNEYKLCQGTVDYVDYGLWEATIKAAVYEDDIAAEIVSREYEWKIASISEIVTWLLDDYEGGHPYHFTRDIRIGDVDHQVNRYAVSTTKLYRDLFDQLASMCGAIWWLEILPSPFQPVFHFVSLNNLVTGDEGLIDDRLTQTSLGLNAVGYFNDVVVIGNGNPNIAIGNGSEIPTTQVVRGEALYNESEEGSLSQRPLKSPTIYDPFCTTREQCLERAKQIKEMAKSNLNVAKPVAIGIAPINNSYVAYHLYDTMIDGIIMAKTVEYSADGWICYMDVVKYDLYEDETTTEESAPSGSFNLSAVSPLWGGLEILSGDRTIDLSATSPLLGAAKIATGEKEFPRGISPIYDTIRFFQNRNEDENK